MYVWLEDHKNINRSQTFREAVERIRNPSRSVSSLMFLASVIGVVMSVTLIAIGISESPINYYARSLMCILGGVLAVATTLIYFKEKKGVKT